MVLITLETITRGLWCLPTICYCRVREGCQDVVDNKKRMGSNTDKGDWAEKG